MVIMVYLCTQPEPPHSFLLLGILAKKRKDNQPLRFEHKEPTISESLQCWLRPFPHMPQNEGNLIRGFLPLAEEWFAPLIILSLKILLPSSALPLLALWACPDAPPPLGTLFCPTPFASCLCHTMDRVSVSRVQGFGHFLSPSLHRPVHTLAPWGRGAPAAPFLHQLAAFAGKGE